MKDRGREGEESASGTSGRCGLGWGGFEGEKGRNKGWDWVYWMRRWVRGWRVGTGDVQFGGEGWEWTS